MVEPQHLDDLRVMPKRGHMKGGGTYVVESMWVCPVVKEPLHSFMTTHEGQQMEQCASGHMLILEKRISS